MKQNTRRTAETPGCRGQERVEWKVESGGSGEVGEESGMIKRRRRERGAREWGWVAGSGERGKGTVGGGGNKHAGASVSSRPSRELVRDELGLSVRRGTKKLGPGSAPILHDENSARDKLALAYCSLLARRFVRVTR